VAVLVEAPRGAVHRRQAAGATVAAQDRHAIRRVRIRAPAVLAEDQSGKGRDAPCHAATEMTVGTQASVASGKLTKGAGRVSTSEDRDRAVR
jgi:hypothetical protein